MKKILMSIALMFVTMSVMAQMPSVNVETAKGEVVNTSTLVDGKSPMILSFWATTCKPCIQELDAINDAYPDWIEMADFRVVAVSTDDSRFTSQARALAEGHGWSDFTTLYDKNQQLMRAMNVTQTPQVFIFDKNGKIVYSHTGYTQGNELELIEAIQKLE